MRILLCGPKAEDGRYPVWQHIALPLRQMGHTVLTFDPTTAVESSKNEKADHQLDWYFQNYQPEVVLDLTSDDVVGKFSTKYQARYEPLSAAHFNIHNGGTPLRLGFNGELFAGQRKSEFIADVCIVTPGLPFVATLANQLAAKGIRVITFGFNWETVSSAINIEFHKAPYPMELKNAFHSAPYTLCVDVSDQTDLPVCSVAIQAAQSIAAGSIPVVSVDNIDMIPPELAPFVLRYSQIDSLVLPETALPTTNQILFDVADDAQWMKLESPRMEVNEYKPKVSVVISSYNVAEYLPQSIESILNQTEQDFEIIACNDGSTDSSAEVIGQYCGDPRVRLINQSNIGQTGRFDTIWNSLTRFVRGDIIAFLGADDIARVDRLEKQLQCFDEHSDLDICHSAAEIIDEHGNVISGGAFTFSESYTQESLARMILTYNVIGAPSIMVKKSVYDRVGPWERGYASDFDYWLKSAATLRYQYVPQHLVQWRQHEKSSSTGYEVDIAFAHGMRIWASERTSKTIYDLYPALNINGASNHALAAAYTDIAIRLLSRVPQPELALLDLERAESSLGSAHFAISLARAVAYQTLDDPKEAARQLQLAKSHNRELIIGTEDLNAANLPEASSISHDPFWIPQRERSKFWVWDGTNADLHRILLVPNYGDILRTSTVISKFVKSFKDTDPVDLVIPTFGANPDLVVAAVSEMASNIPGLEQGGSITVEEIDNVHLVPLSRFDGILSLQDGLTTQDQVQNMQKIVDFVRSQITRTAT